MEDSKSNIEIEDEFDFPFDIHNLMAVQYDPLKVAIEYLARQQKLTNIKIKNLQEMEMQTSAPREMEDDEEVADSQG